MKPAISGIYHLLGAPGGNFWNGLNGKNTLNQPWCDGYRGRTNLAKILPTSIYGSIDFSGIDQALGVLKPKGKKLSLSVGIGLEMPADFYTSDPKVTAFDLHSTDGGASGTIPIIWEPAYLMKIEPIIKALGAKYDSDSSISAVFTTGYQQIAENHVVSTDADLAAYTLAATNYGFATLDDAWLPIAKRLVDIWMAAFPTTPVMFTAGNPWGGGEDGKAMENAMQSYIVDTYPDRGGQCSSFLHASLTHTGVPNTATFIKGDQPISASSDDSRFYKPALPGSQPPAPTPVNDLILNAYDQGDNYLEIYDGDITNSVNWGVIASGRDLLLSNVPSDRRGGHATITAKT